MMTLGWTLLFAASLFVLIKAADYFTKGAELVGLRLSIPAFIVGVTIVSIGTSLPELVTSLVSLAQGEPSIPVANAVGSNIANILLVVGGTAVFAGALQVKRSLIDLDAPLLAISTAILLSVLWDQQVTMLEGGFLLATYIVYVAYTVLSSREENGIEHNEEAVEEELPESVEHTPEEAAQYPWSKIVLYLVLGSVGVYFGADYTIKSVVELGTVLGISASALAITAIAFGTSLPELVVSLSAAKKGHYEIALGNVFGSNIFNSLMVIGVPAMFQTLPVDQSTFSIGLFFMVAATFLYIFSGISKKVHKWEGMMYLVLYLLFVSKIFVAGL